MNSIKPARDQNVYHIHRREVFWQITMPLLVGVLIFVIALVLVIMAGRRGASQGADAAVIWLSIAPILMSLVGLIVLIALAYGLWKLLEAVPGLMYKVQHLIAVVKSKVTLFSNYSVTPFIKAQSASASMRAFWRSLFTKGIR